MATGYPSSPVQQQTDQQEFVPGLLQGEVTFTGILEKYLHTKELISVHTKQLESLETSHKQQNEQIKAIDKVVQELKNLKEEEDKLSRQLDESLRQIETQVKTNTETINQIQSLISTMTRQSLSSQPSVQSAESEEQSSYHGDILSRVVAIEKQVKTNTELLQHTTTIDNNDEATSNDINIKKELDHHMRLITNLYEDMGTLDGKVNKLSIRTKASEQQHDGMGGGIMRRLKRRSSSASSKRLSLPESFLEDFEYLDNPELDAFDQQRNSLTDSGFRSRSTSVRDSLSLSFSAATATGGLTPLNESTPKDSSTPRKRNPS